MCPLEVQAGQLSVENKLLPCFQALWQRDYNPWCTHPHTPHPEPYSPFHPVFRPLPICVNLLTCQKGKCGGFTVKTLNTHIFKLEINRSREVEAIKLVTLAKNYALKGIKFMPNVESLINHGLLVFFFFTNVGGKAVCLVCKEHVVTQYGQLRTIKS